MTQTHVLNDDETTTACLPGAARFLAISAAYLAVTPAAVTSSHSSDYITGANRSVPPLETEHSGVRL